MGGGHFMALSAHDRAAVLGVLRAAVVAYALSNSTKGRVLDGATNEKRLVESVAAARAAAGELSATLRQRTDVNWPELLAEGTDAEAAWRIAKKVVPTLFSELRPLLTDAPETAFLPVAPKPTPSRIARARSRM